MTMKYFLLFLIVMMIPMSSAFAIETKSIYNYNLDDVAFQICTQEYKIYENAASMHMGDPQKLTQWKQYTQCHNDAFLVLHETKHLCLDEITNAEQSKIIYSSIVSDYDKMHYRDYMYGQWQKAIDCHVRVYHEEITKLQTIETPEQTHKETPKEKLKQTSESKIICGKGTIDIDGICQVDTTKIETKTNHKGWFSWIFDIFSKVIN